VPSKWFADVVARLPGGAPVLSLTKGLDPATGERLSSRVEGRPVAVLSGPNIAEEIAVGLPTAAVIASDDGFLAGRLQHAINSSVFRTYVNPDIVGVELCAAAKNVIALAAAGVDGLDLGDNAKASLITRGLAEITRLARREGAQVETLMGLAGLGDLVLTCTGDLSRNRRVGIELGRGRPLDEVLAGMRMVAEGVRTTGAALALGARHGIELPITAQMAAVLDGGVDVPDLREGETLGDVWTAAFGDVPVPYRYEFRMQQDPRPYADR
jgi:glycerol-3-phosphate dehydrogenase (NAD(P)+)